MISHHCPDNKLTGNSDQGNSKQKSPFHCVLVLQFGALQGYLLNGIIIGITQFLKPRLTLATPVVSLTSSMCPQRNNEFRLASKSLFHSTARGTIKTGVVRYLR